jgi:hypothetical protein
MAETITAIIIQVDNRRPGKSGLVISEIKYSNGEAEQDCRPSFPADVDSVSWLNGKVAEKMEGKKQAEIQKNIRRIVRFGSAALIGTHVTLAFSSAAENFTALRNEFAGLEREEAIMVADFLAARTDAQLRAAFSYSQAQVVALRTNKLNGAVILAENIRTASGVPSDG